MTDKQLIKFASDFKRGMLGKHSSFRTCCMVCAPLSALLEYEGVKNTLMEVDLGECNHVYIKLEDGRILDPTADQFNDFGFKPMPYIYLGQGESIHPADAKPKVYCS